VDGATAKVVMMSDRNVFAAVEARSGDYAVMIAEGADIALGDELQGEFSGSGTKELRNATQGRSVRVSVDDWGCTRKRAIDRVRNLNLATKVDYLRGFGPIR
jgi:hypothetical protein